MTMRPIMQLRACLREFGPEQPLQNWRRPAGGKQIGWMAAARVVERAGSTVMAEGEKISLAMAPSSCQIFIMAKCYEATHHAIEDK